jgi:hypothetical protein
MAPMRCRLAALRELVGDSARDGHAPDPPARRVRRPRARRSSRDPSCGRTYGAASIDVGGPHCGDSGAESGFLEDGFCISAPRLPHPLARSSAGCSRRGTTPRPPVGSTRPQDAAHPSCSLPQPDSPTQNRNISPSLAVKSTPSTPGLDHRGASGPMPPFDSKCLWSGGGRPSKRHLHEALAWRLGEGAVAARAIVPGTAAADAGVYGSTGGPQDLAHRTLFHDPALVHDGQRSAISAMTPKSCVMSSSARLKRARNSAADRGSAPGW